MLSIILYGVGCIILVFVLTAMSFYVFKSEKTQERIKEVSSWVIQFVCMFATIQCVFLWNFGPIKYTECVDNYVVIWFDTEEGERQFLLSPITCETDGGDKEKENE